MPPVLHVALDELAARAAQQLLAHERRRGVHQRHRVLQLVAEAEGAARLVVAAARPQPAREGLVQQPAVGQHVERGVRRVDLHRARACAASARAPPAALTCAAAGPRAALHEARRVARGASDARAGTRSRAPRRRRDRTATCIAAQGSSAGAHLARQAGARQRGRRRERAVAAQELGAIAGHAARRIVDVEERDAVGKLGVVGVAREQRRRCADRSR